MKLHRICQLIGCRDLSHVMLEWERILGEEFYPLSRFLLPTDEIAARYPGTDASFACDLHVKVMSDGKIIGHVRGTRIRFELKMSDVLEHRFDLWNFRCETLECLGLTSQFGEISKWDHTIPWGTWEPERGTAFPVTHFIGGYPSRSFQERVVEVALRRKAAGEIIFTPERSEWSPDSCEIARRHNILLVPLDEVLQMEDDKFMPTPEWDEYLLAFCKMVEMDLPSSLQKNVAAPNEFRRKGQMWVVRFQDNEAYFKDSIGLRCIAQLLAKPNQPVFVSDLKMIVDGRNPDDLPAPSSNGEIADQEYVREVAKKYLKCESEYKNAQERGELWLAEEIQDEMTKLMNFLREAKGFGGRAKDSNDQLNSIRVAIYRAIDRSLETIKPELPDCFHHLERRICTGLVLNYLPENNVSWVL